MWAKKIHKRYFYGCICIYMLNDEITVVNRRKSMHMCVCVCFVVFVCAYMEVMCLFSNPIIP